MSNLSLDDDDGPMLKARSRRTFELPSSATSSLTSTPPLDTQSLAHDGRKGSESGAATPARSRSILNLTSSTLFGIYQPTGYDINQDGPTPWGTGAQTPIDGKPDPLSQLRSESLTGGRPNRPAGAQFRRRSTMTPAQFHRQRRGFKGYVLPLLGRTITLAVAGVLYGLLISHLHDSQTIAPVQVDLDRSGWAYLVFWAVVGVLLGEAFPRADLMWIPEDVLEFDEPEQDQERQSSRSMGAWNDVVRSVGAFIGVAFAIRKLPWQSTLQLSLTLAMANPAIWYLIDRSPPGFALSTIFALCGTAAVLGMYPTLIPSPTSSLSPLSKPFGDYNSNVTKAIIPPEELVLGIFTQESIAVTTWIASVLFVSSVCFGNIGRRLAPIRP